MLASRALAPAGQVVGLLMQYQGARTALRNLEQADGPAGRAARRRRPSSTGRSCAATSSSATFSFAYPGRSDSALDGLSFKIAAGEHVALIGRVGSGKSTIQRLIMGLYQPTDGAVLLDGIDLRQLDPADVRRNVGYVSQDVTLFYGTLRENIAFGLPYADDSRGGRRGRGGRPGGVRQPPSARLRHAGRRARRIALGRPAAERRPGARGAAQRAHAAARRADQRDGLLHRGADHDHASAPSRRTRRSCW